MSVSSFISPSSSRLVSLNALAQLNRLTHRSGQVIRVAVSPLGRNAAISFEDESAGGTDVLIAFEPPVRASTHDYAELVATQQYVDFDYASNEFILRKTDHE